MSVKEVCCYSDGSWTQQWNGGIGVIIERNEELVTYKSERVKGSCPLHTEAIALREDMNMVSNMGFKMCVLL